MRIWRENMKMKMKMKCVLWNDKSIQELKMKNVETMKFDDSIHMLNKCESIEHENTPPPPRRMPTTAPASAPTASNQPSIKGNITTNWFRIWIWICTKLSHTPLPSIHTHTDASHSLKIIQSIKSEFWVSKKIYHRQTFIRLVLLLPPLSLVVPLVIMFHFVCVYVQHITDESEQKLDTDTKVKGKDR